MNETVYDDVEAIIKRSERHLDKGDGYVPWGTGLVEGAKDLAGRAIGQLQEWAKDDPDTWTDDALRLMGGGVKNVGNTMADWERRSEEGEVGIRSAAGTALRFMNWSSEKGADMGGAVVGALGGNEDIGRFLGSFLPEALGTKGLSKVAQVGKTTRQLRKLRSLGALPMELDAATIGKYSFAFGDKAEGLGSDLVKATKGSFREGTASKLKNIEHSLKGEHLLQAGRSKTALKSQLSVKKRIAEWLPEQVKNSGSIDDVKRAGFGTIVDEAGDVKEVQGLHRYWSSVQEGKPDPKLLTFVSRKSRIKGAIGRINRMQAPEEALTKLAKEVGLPDEVVEKYLKSNMRDFGNVQEAARLQGLTVRQRTNELGRKVTNPKKWKTRKGELNKDQILYDAGHWRGTESLESPIWKARGDELGQAPTSGYAARIEAAKKNRAGSGKIEHDINPLAAREAGIPRTWEEDFLYFADREMGYNLVPDWKSDFSGEALEMIEAIPYNADQAYVNKVFKKIAEIDRKKSMANPLKPHKRDLRIEKVRRPGKNEEDLQWLREQLNKV